MNETPGSSEHGSRAGHDLASRRRQYKLHCAQCSKELTGTRRRRFCDSICQRNNYREREEQAVGSVPSIDEYIGDPDLEPITI